MNNVTNNFNMLASQQQGLQQDVNAIRAVVQTIVTNLMEMEKDGTLPGTKQDKAVDVASNGVSRTEVSEMIQGLKRQLEQQIADVRKEQSRANILLEANVTDKAERMAARTALREINRATVLQQSTVPQDNTAADAASTIPVAAAAVPVPVAAAAVPVAAAAVPVPVPKRPGPKRKVAKQVNLDIDTEEVEQVNQP
jgi:hypothetical protein